MKKIIFIVLLLVVLPLVAQRQKATLFLKNGTELKGLAKITGQKQNKIKFRKAKGEKKQFFSGKELESILIRDGDKDAEYRYKTIQGQELPKLLEVLKKGKVTLYRIFRSGYVAGAPGPNGIPMGGHSYSISSYYVSKDNENTVFHLGTKGSLFSKNFKKAASEYFKDCSELVKKIQNKEFKKRDIVEIVEFYNENCN